MSFATEEGLTEGNKARYVENGVGRKVMELAPVELQKAPEEGVNRETKAPKEEWDKIDSLLSMRRGVIVGDNPYICGLQSRTEGCKI